jgi:hypothetical protein
VVPVPQDPASGGDGDSGFVDRALLRRHLPDRPAFTPSASASSDPKGPVMRHAYTTRAVWMITAVLLAACVWFALALG